jgi:uncharacterized protein
MFEKFRNKDAPFLTNKTMDFDVWRCLKFTKINAPNQRVQVWEYVFFLFFCQKFLPPKTMKKIVKIVLMSLLGLVLLTAGLLAGFVYKVKNGFPVSYETEHPQIAFVENQPAILLFSKTTGFRHGESIDASKPVLTQMAQRNGWFLYETEDGGVFNTEQLGRFKAVIFNNSTGRVLNDEQQQALEMYVENGGTLLGIHGAGDDSHHWDWYLENFIGATFSHHPLSPQLQQAEVRLQAPTDSSLTQGLAPAWTHSDEWYIFFTNPKQKGFEVVYAIDGETILPSGNMLWMTEKNFGMGKDHPVAWYKRIGKGKTFYTSMGHTAAVWQQADFVRLLEAALRWGMK